MRGAYQNPGTKRGSDMSNGSAMSPSPNYQDNDAKKIRMDSRNPSGVSRVVHIRQIPNEVTEAEIVQMGLPFGKVVNVLVLKGKNQAFLEMDDEMSATTMVNYFQSCPANLRGRQVFVQFSNHKELKTDSTHPGVTSLSGLQGSPQSGQSLMGPSFQGGEKTVLRVIIDHMIYPVTLDVLNQIFSRAGQVLKIVTFTKLNTFQALIQFADADTAHQAKMNLSGQNIYNGCCTLRIEDSKLTNLNVKFNNDKSRDYTNPNLPTGDPSIDQSGGINFSGMGGMNQQGLMPLPSNLAPNMGGMGGMPGMGGMQGNMMNAATGMRLPGQMIMNCVLLVSNLNEDEVSTDAIFTLFGVYGDVQRVKILYNKKDTALVQMSEPHQTQLAISHLDKVEVWGNQIRVTQSKHSQVQLPRDDQSDAASLTKDYSNSPLHRFKKPGSKNFQNIYPPSATLHLSNIPSTVEEEEVKEAFSETGATVVGFKFFQKDRKMALIQLGSVQDAIMALIKMHNHQLAERTYLRVSFSKSTI